MTDALNRPTLLVTGASGFLGWHLCHQATLDWNVIGVCRSTSTSIRNVDVQTVDLTKSVQVAALLDSIKPDAVIHAAALANPNTCEQTPAVSERINVGTTRQIAAWCGHASVPMVFTSTDLVFNGLEAPYSELDPPSPICVYGEHKLAAERVVLDHAPNGLVCRLPLMFGDRNGAPASFIGPWI